MTQFHKLLSVAAIGALVPATALAHGTATVTVKNKFDGEADVRIDGKYVGRVAGNATVAFSTNAGDTAVVVTRPATGYVLASTNLYLGNGASVLLPVDPPRGTLRIQNTGEVKLKLDVDANSVWIAPGASISMLVESGNVGLSASIHDPHGDWQAIARTLWVEPGQIATTSLAPEPTVVVITNRDRVPVRALLDGDDAGWIDPGDTERVWVRPGRTQVVLVDKNGRVRSSTALVVSKGNEAKLVLAASGPAPVVVVAAAAHDGRGDDRDDDRPSGRPSYR